MQLAFSIATNMTVLCMLYGAMMGDYGGLYLPMMIVGYIFSVPFFLLTVKTSQKHGQKASLVRYTMLALVMYIGVLVLLLLWKQGVPAFNLSLRSINVYTVLFVIFLVLVMVHTMQPQICRSQWLQTVLITRLTVPDSMCRVSWEHCSHWLINW